MAGTSPAMTGGEREQTVSAARAARASCRMLQHGGGGHGRNIADFEARGKNAFAAILERHLGRDIGLLGAAIERRDQRSVTFRDEAPSYFLSAGDLSVIRVELLVQDEEAPDLRARHRRLASKRAVHLLHMLRQHVIDERMTG